MFSSLKITLNALGVGFFRILAARTLEREQKHDKAGGGSATTP